MKRSTFKRLEYGFSGELLDQPGYLLDPLPPPWDKYSFFIWKLEGGKMWRINEVTSGGYLGTEVSGWTRKEAIGLLLPFLEKVGEERLKQGIEWYNKWLVKNKEEGKDEH